MFDSGYESIPPELDDLEPGPELGGILACIDVSDVAPHDRVTVMRAHRRQRSFYDAQVYRDMTAIVAVMDDDNPQWRPQNRLPPKSGPPCTCREVPPMSNYLSPWSCTAASLRCGTRW